MSDYNEEYVEQDFGEDIKAKEALIEEAKELGNIEDWNEANKKANNLRKKWRKIPYYESLQEEDLKEKFEAALDVVYAKKEEILKKSAEVKENLIAQAKEVSLSDEFNKATKKMNELMEEWKKSGRAGSAKDDELWAQFAAARKTFFDRKNQYYEELNKKFAEAKDVKSQLVEEAKKLQDSEQWQKTSQKLKDMMDQWKAAGHAGKEYENSLWEDFNAARQVFYDRRASYYEELHKQQDINYEQKMALVNQAKGIVNSGEFTRENTETMKQLSSEWKKVGSCGKEKENTVWKEFRAVNDEYFDGLTKFNEQKHEDWKKRMNDSKANKQNQIDNQKRQIARLQDDLNGLISEEQATGIKYQIADKEEFIQQLEAEIADIDKKINE